jgi:hypothetical protein
MATSKPVRTAGALGLAILGVAAAVLLGACDSFQLYMGGGTQPIALLYGVSYYYPSYPVTSSPNLEGPDNDVDALQSALTASGWSVIARKDSAATSTQLAADIASLALIIKPGQRVLFYWSGHGLQYPNGSTVTDSQYLGMYGVVRPGLGSYDLTAMVNASRLASLFKPLGDRNANLIFVLDSCYSGGFVFNSTYASGLPDNYSSIAYLGDPNNDNAQFANALANYFGSVPGSGNGLDSPRIWVMSAAGKNEVSMDSSSVKRGVFSYFFSMGGTLNGGTYPADYNGDRHVSLMESYRYCLLQIQANWNTKAGSSGSADYQFKPHLSGNPLDIKIF